MLSKGATPVVCTHWALNLFQWQTLQKSIFANNMQIKNYCNKNKHFSLEHLQQTGAMKMDAQQNRLDLQQLLPLLRSCSLFLYQQKAVDIKTLGMADDSWLRGRSTKFVKICTSSIDRTSPTNGRYGLPLDSFGISSHFTTTRYEQQLSMMAPGSNCKKCA